MSQVGLTPHFVNLKLHSDNISTSNPVRRFATRKWMHCELARWHGKLNVANRLAMLSHYKLSMALTPLMMGNYLQRIQEDCFIHNRSLQEKKDHKIKVLLDERTPPPSDPPSQTIEFFPRLVNYSSTKYI